MSHRDTALVLLTRVPSSLLEVDAHGRSPNWAEWSVGIRALLQSATFGPFTAWDTVARSRPDAPPAPPAAPPPPADATPPSSGSTADTTPEGGPSEQGRARARADATTAAQFLTAQAGPSAAAPVSAALMADWVPLQLLTRAYLELALSGPLRLTAQREQFASPFALWNWLTAQFATWSLSLLAGLHRDLLALRSEQFESLTAFFSRYEELCTAILEYEASVDTYFAINCINVLSPDHDLQRALFWVRHTDAVTRRQVYDHFLTAERQQPAPPPHAAASHPPPSRAPSAGYPLGTPNPLHGVGRCPPCEYLILHGPEAGQYCGGTNHTTARCFYRDEDAWYAANPAAARAGARPPPTCR